MGLQTRRWPVLLGVAIAFYTVPVAAQELFPHRGSVGLLVGAGPAARTTSALNNSGLLALGELGVSFGLFEHQELLLFARPGYQNGLRLGLAAGVRSVYGLNAWKTFLDLTVSAELVPNVFVGPRGAFGVQYDFGHLFGIYTALGLGIGFGNGLFVQGELTLGFHFRTYVL
jgi:hypothetical protein